MHDPTPRPRTSLLLLAAIAHALGLAAAPRPAPAAPPRGMQARPSYRPNDPARPTVCLVHGMNSSSGSFVHLVPLLESEGYGVVLYDYPFDRDLDRSAPEFARDVKAFRAAHQERRPWAMLTHSMGALLARYYLEDPAAGGAGTDVAQLIMIAPPNAGSAIAKAQRLVQLMERLKTTPPGSSTAQARALFAGLGEAADDLLPGSRFLTRLNAYPRRQGVRYRILAGDAGFLTPEARRSIESQFSLMARSRGVLGSLSALAAGDLSGPLQELTTGTGDGVVSVASTRLPGVTDHETIHANHVELIRGPLLYPDPGPVACWPIVSRWLRER